MFHNQFTQRNMRGKGVGNSSEVRVQSQMISQLGEECNFILLSWNTPVLKSSVPIRMPEEVIPARVTTLMYTTMQEKLEYTCRIRENWIARQSCRFDVFGCTTITSSIKQGSYQIIAW